MNPSVHRELSNRNFNFVYQRVQMAGEHFDFREFRHECRGMTNDETQNAP
jgi:hypothetical protein